MSAHMAISLRALGLKPSETAFQRLKDAHAAIGAGPAIGWVLYENLREKASTVRTRNDGRHWPTPLDFRARTGGLPTTKFESVDWTHPVIDAPCAAAAIAQGGLSWSLGGRTGDQNVPRLRPELLRGCPPPRVDHRMDGRRTNESHGLLRTNFECTVIRSRQ